MFHLGLISVSPAFSDARDTIQYQGHRANNGADGFLFLTLTTSPSPVIQPLLRDYCHFFALISLLRRKTHNKNRMLLAVL